MPRITDKSFVYTPSFDTDLKKKFKMIIDRERKFERERAAAEKAAAEQAKADEAERASKLVPMKARAKS